RARLQAEALEIFDGVVLERKHAVQAAVQVGNVVAAVEVVVDEDLPVALDDPFAPLGEMERADLQRRELTHQLAEEIVERPRVEVEVEEDELLPDRDGQ